MNPARVPDSAATPASSPRPRRWAATLKGTAVLAAIVAVLLAARYSGLQQHLQRALDAIRGLGFWGPALFILLYIVACVCFIPGSILTLGGGAIYGPLYGSVYVLIGAVLGATAAFLVGRHVVRGWVTERIGHHPTFAAIDRAVADEGWKIVLLVRLCPIFPFVLTNYAFGLTQVTLRHYFLASAVGMIPASVAFVYLGSLANAPDSAASPAHRILNAAGLIATFAVTIYITRVARRALGRRLTPAPTSAPTPAPPNRP